MNITCTSTSWKAKILFSCFSFTTHFHDSFVMVSTITHRSWFTYRHEGDHIITPCIWKSGTYSFFARTTNFLYRLTHTRSSQRPVGRFVLQFFLSKLFFPLGSNNVIAHARQWICMAYKNWRIVYRRMLFIIKR